MTQRVLRQDADGLCMLTLNRPDKLNALDTPTFEELDAHLARLERQTEKVGCVVLRGAGRGFCAGADLNAIGKIPAPADFKPDIMTRLSALPQPVIAAVHGVCYTGGLGLALACDFILSDPAAFFADTHGKWGFAGAWGISQRLPRRIGVPTAKRMMMTARTVNAEEALEIGLVDLLSSEGRLDDLVSTFAGDILANSWHTNFVAKRIMRETDHMPLAEALAHERAHYPGDAPDHMERIVRFSKK